MSPFGIYFSAIPRVFWSDYSGQPFVKCIECGVPLVEANLFVIQKRYVAGEAVFEMAMCEHCRECMTKEYSEETRQNITAYMAKQFQRAVMVALDEADEDAADTEASDIQVIEVREIEDAEAGQKLLDHCMNHCLICNAEREKCHRYSLAALCRSSEIIVQVTPMSRTPLMICEECEMGMADLISVRTRDAWDRFIEKHFGGPPGIESDLPDSYPVAF